MRIIPTPKKRTPNYSWFSLGSNNTNISTIILDPRWRSYFRLGRKDLLHPITQRLKNMLSIGASKIIKLHSTANCQYKIVVQCYSTSIVCVELKTDSGLGYPILCRFDSGGVATKQRLGASVADSDLTQESP